MRIRLGTFVIAAAASLSLGSPSAVANGDAADEKARVKQAGSAVRAILKAFGKQMAGVRLDAARMLGDLTKAAKTGENVEALSGVASTPGTDVSPEQRAGLVEACMLGLAQYCDDGLDACHDAYLAYAASPECDELQATDTILRLPGTGGPPDLLTSGLTLTWDKNLVALNKKVIQFRDTLTPGGFTFTLTLGPAPPFTTPNADAAPIGALRAPFVFATGGDSIGGRVAIFGFAPDAGSTESNTRLVYNDFAGTASSSEFIQLTNVRLEKFDEVPPEPAVGRIFIIDYEGSGTPVRPAFPLTLTSPGPCLPSVTGSLVASPSAVHLGTVLKGGLPEGKELELTNRTSNDMPLVVSIDATGTSVGKFFAIPPNFTIPANGKYTLFVGGSSTTAGNFNATLYFVPSQLQVKVDMTVPE